MGIQIYWFKNKRRFESILIELHPKVLCLTFGMQFIGKLMELKTTFSNSSSNFLNSWRRVGRFYYLYRTLFLYGLSSNWATRTTFFISSIFWRLVIMFYSFFITWAGFSLAVCHTFQPTHRTTSKVVEKNTAKKTQKLISVCKVYCSSQCLMIQ